MATKKKEDEEDDEEEWTPDKPIPDEEGETTAQRKVMLDRRIKYLNEEAEKAGKKKPKGKVLGIGW